MDTSEYLPMFLAECRENLQELNLAVVRLEEAPEDRETIDAIFRIAHSLKGMAATMGFEGMAKLTHKTEDVFELLRQRGTGLTGEVATVVLAVLDALEGAVDSIDAGEGEKLDPEPLIQRLGDLVRDSDEPAEADAAPAAPAPVLAALEEGQAVFEVQVVLSDEVQMPSVRALQLFGGLAEHGEILRTVPAEEDLEGWTGSVIEALVATDSDAEMLAIAARDVPDVTDVRVAEHEQDPIVDVPLVQIVPAADDTPAADVQESGSASGQKKHSQTVRVDADRLDSLMHCMGELVVQRTLVEALAADADVPGLGQAMQELQRSSHALQAMVMQIRMIPVEAVFMRFPRLVRDVATRLDKQVDLQLIGKETELDRTVVDAIGDPLVHLIRNSLDHGLEPADERIAAGKSPTGTLTIAARHAGGSIVITVKDDGRGIDPAKVAAIAVKRGIITPEQVPTIDVRAAIELLFAPGFSTADEVGDLSGRGVGMDAVREKLRELGGEVNVTSVTGEGTENEIRLPLTLAIVSALLIEAGGRPFGIPLQRVERTLLLEGMTVRSVAGQKMLLLDDEALPLISASRVFGAAAGTSDSEDTHVVIVRGQDRSIALSVSKLVGQVELVTRPLPSDTGHGGSVSGAAVLSSGDIVLLADCDSITHNSAKASAGSGDHSILTAA
jgi:two-component system chemotaxis sensor kinase CheA